MMHGTHRVTGHGRRGEQGTATVELALLVTLLTFMLFGMITFAKALRIRLVIGTAANDCAVTLTQSGYVQTGPTYAFGQYAFDGGLAASAEVVKVSGIPQEHVVTVGVGQGIDVDPAGRKFMMGCEVRYFGRDWQLANIPPLADYAAYVATYYYPMQRYRAESWDMSLGDD